MRFQDVIARGTRSAQPAATAVSVGSLYFVTDEGVTERSSGTAWESYSGSGAIANDAVTYAKMQNVSAASKLIGRGSAGGSGDPEEITVGSGLTMTGTTLSSSGGGGAGAVVQVVHVQTGAVATGTTPIPLDDTIPQNTEGDEYLTLAITPTDAANRLRIDVVFMGTVDLSAWVIVALFQDAIANALAVFANYQNTGTGGCNSIFTHVLTAGTTSAMTFKVRAGRDSASGNTLTFNGSSGSRKFGGVMASSLTITEIVP